MKSCTPQIAERLLQNPAVTALVGQRIYLFQAIQNAPIPDIVLMDIAGSFNLNLQGAGDNANRRVQVTCRAKTYMEADAIGEVVLHTIKGIRGPLGGFDIHAVIPVSDTALFDDTTNINHRILDFRIHYL